LGKIKQFVNKQIFMTLYTFKNSTLRTENILISPGHESSSPQIIIQYTLFKYLIPLVPGHKAPSPRFTLQYILFKYLTLLLPGHEISVTST